LHECRHSYAAYAMAAGINPKALSSYMGHSSITVTLDRYGHLRPATNPSRADARQLPPPREQRHRRNTEPR
jgi:integrase